MDAHALEVNFADSSDEDFQHAARMELVPDSGEPVDAHEPLSEDNRRQSGGAWANLWSRVSRGATTTLTYALGDPKALEPFADTKPRSAGGDTISATRAGGEGSSRSQDDSNWGYGVFGSSLESTGGSSTRDDDSTALGLDRDRATQRDAADNSGSVAIDLRNTILQYQHTPADFYMNLILATLKSETVVIDGDILSAAAGSPLMMKICLDSGCVDEDDAKVQELVQEEINQVLQGDPYEGCYVAAEQADYLSCLVRLRSARITNEQLVLMRYSGFEFIKMLHSNPHLYSHTQNGLRISSFLFRFLTVFHLISAWIGIVAELTLSGATAWSAVYWFHGDTRKTNNGFWTIICYVFGFVVGIVVTSVSEQSKIRHYDHEQFRFPDNRLKFIPLVPSYELALMFTLFRYERLSSKDMYFIIRYDLRNAIALQQIFVNICCALPQILVQAFLHYDRAQQLNTSFSEPCFWLLIGGGSACFFVATFAMMRVVIFAHSCNSLGFAFMHVVPTNVSHFRRVLPSDIVTRFLVYAVFCLCVSTIVTVICPIFNLSDCSGAAKAYLSIFIGVSGMTVVLAVLLTLFAPFSRLLGLLALPTVIMQIAFFPFASSEADANKALPFGKSCGFFRYAKSAYLVPLYVVFGFTVLILLPWIVMCLIEFISGKRLRQQRVDNYVR